MNDGNLLLLAVLRAKARDATVNKALVDWIQDHIPGDGRRTEIRAKLRVREAVIFVSLTPAKWVFKNGLMRPVDGKSLLKVEAMHDRGPRLGTRGMTVAEWPDSPRIALEIEQTFAVFRF